MPRPQNSIVLFGYSYDMTALECRVLSLICEGMSNLEIEQQLNLKQSTVLYMIAKLFKKTGCKNRTALACLCLKSILNIERYQ